MHCLELTVRGVLLLLTKQSLCGILLQVLFLSFHPKKEGEMPAVIQVVHANKLMAYAKLPVVRIFYEGNFHTRNLYCMDMVEEALDIAVQRKVISSDEATDLATQISDTGMFGTFAEVCKAITCADKPLVPDRGGLSFKPCTSDKCSFPFPHAYLTVRFGMKDFKVGKDFITLQDGLELIAEMIHDEVISTWMGWLLFKDLYDLGLHPTAEALNDAFRDLPEKERERILTERDAKQKEHAERQSFHDAITHVLRMF
jgi:hypothetical protein